MKQLIIILSVLICSAFVKAQTNVDYVRSQYPEVYIDIYNSALSQFRGSPELQEKDIQEQVYAFLDLAERDGTINDNAMTEALIRWSKKGEEMYNRDIIEDIAISNPFPYLRCDWVLARLHYNRSESGIDNATQKGAEKRQVVNNYPQATPGKPMCGQCPLQNDPSMCPYANQRNVTTAMTLTPSNDRMEENVRCTANGECITCKSNNKSRDFCSHLTPDYIRLLNQRHERSALRGEYVKSERKFMKENSDKYNYRNRYNRHITEEPTITEEAESVVQSDPTCPRYQKRRVEVIRDQPQKRSERQMNRQYRSRVYNQSY